MKIKALRQFSHYHLGTIDQDETRTVPDDIGAALVGMELAEEVGAEGVVSEPAPDKPAAKQRRGRGVS